MNRRTKVPSIPDPTPDGLVDVARSVKNLLDVREGRAGDKQDRFVSFRDLEEMNLITDAQTKSEDPGNNGGVPNPNPGYDPGADLTVPPIPTGFTVTGGYGVIMLDWDTPQAQYNNHAYTEIWRNTVDVIGNAVLVGTTIAAVYTDPVPASTTYYYWIRFVSQANITGPYNSTSGTSATSSIDVPAVLNALNGQITSSQLYADLNSRINLIDGDEGLPGSVSYRMKQVSDQNEAQFGYFERLYADLNSAVARQTTTLSTTVAGNTTSIQVNAESINGIQGKYTVKIDNNGSVSGYGLISTANNGTPTSNFFVNANRFAITAPANASGANLPSTSGLSAGYTFYQTTTQVTWRYTGSGWEPLTEIAPFIVQTTPTTVNGVSVPAGVYMDAAYIKNGTITSAKIGDAVITSAKIANAAITSAKIGDAQITTAKIADTIQSSNWNATLGYGWQINKAGTATFNDVTVRGTVYASAGSFTGTIYAGSGTIGGITLGSNSIYANYSSGVSGFTINYLGQAEFNDVTVRGTVYASAGSFSGSLSAATGTFSGTLTASAIDAVNTINIAGNAVTIPVTASQSSDVTISTYGANSGSTVTWYDIVSVTLGIGTAVSTAKAIVGFTAQHGLGGGADWVIMWRVVRTSDSSVIGSGLQFVPNNQLDGATVTAVVADGNTGNGDKTYKLQIANYGSINDARVVKNSVIFAIGAKR